MTSNIVPSNFSFQSNTVRGDGLVNVTALASAYKAATGKRKDCYKWLLTSDAIESIAYLERVTQKSVTELVAVEDRVGTWVHPDLAEIFAQWISVEYRFAVVQLIRTAKENKPQPRQLPPSRDIVEYIQAFQLCGLMDDPMIRSLIT